MKLHEILEIATKNDASDIFIIAGLPVTMKCHGELVHMNEEMIKPPASAELVDEVRDYLNSLGVFEEILETRAGGVISSHCGPGTLGVLFYEN